MFINENKLKQAIESNERSHCGDSNASVPCLFLHALIEQTYKKLQQSLLFLF